MTLTDTTTPDTTPDPAGITTEAGTTTERTAEAEAASDRGTGPAAEQLGELLWVDPCKLRIGVNVRGDAQLNREFVDSIRERGVREPIIVRRDSAGELVVRKGKRRTLAAVEAGLAGVRVLLEPGDPGEAEPDEQNTAERIDLIIDQLEENHHRRPNTDTEEVAAHQELLGLNLKASDIARRTHIPVQRVKKTKQVADNELARKAQDRYQLSLDHAAVLVEFADGTEAGDSAVKALTVAAVKQPDQFDHVAQRLRDQRRDAALIAALRGELAEAGVRLLDGDQIGEAAMLTRLRPRVTDPAGTVLTPEAHASCAGHAAHVRVPSSNHPPGAVADYYCTIPDQHADRYGPGGRSQPMTAQQKADLRLTRVNNQAAKSATTVRRKWVTDLLARKSPPRDAMMFIALQLAEGSHAIRKAMESRHRTACALLGMGESAAVFAGRPNPLVEAAKDATGPKATRLALAIVLGALEEALPQPHNLWRNPTEATRAYLRALAGWGYPLSTIEREAIAVNAPRARTVNTLNTEPPASEAATEAGHTDPGHPETDEADAGHTDADESAEEPTEAGAEAGAEAGTVVGAKGTSKAGAKSRARTRTGAKARTRARTQTGGKAGAKAVAVTSADDTGSGPDPHDGPESALPRSAEGGQPAGS